MAEVVVGPERRVMATLGMNSRGSRGERSKDIEETDSESMLFR